MKSMPPSGVFGVTMDDEALIEAEIAQQLDQINLDADDFQYEENEEEIQDVDLDIPLEDETLPDGMSDYINQIQKQASNFEKELAECDELLQHHTPGPKLLLNEEELGTLEQLAKERGESPETYRKKILEEVEDFDISDFSSLLVDDNDEQKDANDNSMALVHLDEKQLEFQRKFKETLKKMEETQKEREEKLKQEILEDRKREQEDFEGKEKKWMEKFAALQREETQLAAERKIQEEKFEMELKDKEIEIEKELKYYEEEIEKLESETKHEQEQLEHERSEELKKQELKQQQSATKIQARYRGYSVRKQYKETLQEMKEERERKWEEERIKEVEEEIQRQKEEDRQKKIKEEAERKAEEEAKRKKEEEEKKKAEAERKAKEKAERKAKEEAKRKAEEEVKRKAEEEAKKKAKEEEAKRKAEEEARRKAEEEAKMKAEEEAKRKMEEEAKRKAEEEAKKKAAEEAKRKEEETKRKAEEEARKQAEEEARKHAEEELKRKEEEAARIKAEEEARQREEVVATRKAMEAEAVKEPRKGQEIEKSKVPVSGKTSLGSPRPLSARSKSKGKYQEDFDIFEMDDSKKLQTSTLLLQGLPENLEKLRLQWIKECVPWSKVSNEPWKLKSVSSKSIRRPTSAKKLQPLSEATIVMAARVSTLRQVTTVELQDLPGCNISTLGQCWGLKSLKMSKCNLTVIEGLQQCKQLHFLDLQDNFIQYVDLKDLSNLTFLDLSHNSLSTIHGLAGCSNLRWLDLSNNKITRIGGLESLRRLHTLKMFSNQLISTTGLNDTPTLQLIDISNNHLQTVEDISKLCLLQTLMVSSNNLQKLPCLRNHVLLRVLCLEDNSIGDLEELQSDWLPLLEILNLSQNSIEDLVPLNNLLILRHFDISHNQITDVDTLASSVEKCVHLESMCIAGNPATELTEINLSLPNLKKLDDKIFGSGIEVKPRTSFEAMCISQAQLYTDLANNMLKEIGVQKSSLPWDLGSLCDLYFKYCDTTQRLAEEHRYAHEYGEITMAMPTAPSTPKSSQRPASSKSVRQAQRESQLLNPKEMFERALKSSEKEAKGGKMTINGDSSAKLNGAIDGGTFVNSDEKKSTGISAKTVKALVDEDIDIGQSRKFSDLQSVAAMKIQAHWRGHRVRRQIWGAMGQVEGLGLDEKDHEILQELHQAATKIQAVWRGYILRLRLEQALEFAKFEDEDDYDFQEVDLKEFNFDEEMLEDWKPPPTPQLPVNHPVLGKPPSGKQASPPSKVPLLNLTDKPHPPANPRRAWRGMDSPLSDVQQNGHVPRPPSIASVTDTHRTAMSKKEELLSEEWGFKDANTAHMMMQRAKKLKYNAERRKKLGKLDPKQRLALFRRLEETNVSRKPVTHPSRQTLPRKEYFQARQEEIDKKELEKRVMSNLKNSRTFEWIHNQVGSFEESEHNVHPVKPARQMYGADNNLPRIDPQVVGGRHVRLTGSPALDLQSVDSVSLQGEMVHPPRRFSAGSEASSGARFPPIKTNSAGSGKKRERISFRDNETSEVEFRTSKCLGHLSEWTSRKKS